MFFFLLAVCLGRGEEFEAPDHFIPRRQASFFADESCPLPSCLLSHPTLDLGKRDNEERE